MEFRVLGSVFRVSGSGFRVSGSGLLLPFLLYFWVEGSEFRVQGVMFRGWGSVFRVSGSVFRVSFFVFRFSCFVFHVPCSVFRASSFVCHVSCCGTRDQRSGFRVPRSEFQIQCFGVRPAAPMHPFRPTFRASCLDFRCFGDRFRDPGSGFRVKGFDLVRQGIDRARHEHLSSQGLDRIRCRFPFGVWGLGFRV